MSERRPGISQHEAVYTIRELWPELHSPGYVLWNHTAFPFYDGDDPLSYWISQVADYLEDPEQGED